jgi:addiction module HigA family antidote
VALGSPRPPEPQTLSPRRPAITHSPDEILADELAELGMSAVELARLLDVAANRISQILAGSRTISADTALRLGHYFGTSADLWMNLQKTYELDTARAAIGAEPEAAAMPRVPLLRPKHNYQRRVPQPKET